MSKRASTFGHLPQLAHTDANHARVMSPRQVSTSGALTDGPSPFSAFLTPFRQAFRPTVQSSLSIRSAILPRAQAAASALAADEAAASASRTSRNTTPSDGVSSLSARLRNFTASRLANVTASASTKGSTAFMARNSEVSRGSLSAGRRGVLISNIAAREDDPLMNTYSKGVFNHDFSLCLNVENVAADTQDGFREDRWSPRTALLIHIGLGIFCWLLAYGLIIGSQGLGHLGGPG